ncbi:MAG: hypothetical protein ACRDL4_10715 [Thermoleophilaceae bacterium]
MEERVGLAQVRLFAVAMIFGPVLLLGSSIAFAAGGGLNEDELGGALLVYAFVAMTVVAIGIARAVEQALPRASAPLLAFAVLGCGAGVGFGIDSIHAALPGGTGLEDADSAAATLALFVPGAIFPLSFAALGLALWRARVSPTPSGPLLVAASLLFPVANIPDSEAIAVTANALFVVALWPLGMTWLRQPRIIVRRGARIESESDEGSARARRRFA